MIILNIRRNITHYGNPGYVSGVYCVEKYRDADNTILKMSRWFPKDETYFYENRFRRFMQISVHPEHFNIHPTTYQDMSSVRNNHVTLGTQDKDSIWNYGDSDHIKLRLESTTTGKKIDFNLFFKYNNTP